MRTTVASTPRPGATRQVDLADFEVEFDDAA